MMLPTTIERSRYPDGSRQAEPVGVAEIEEGRGQIVKRLAVRHADRHAAQQDQHRQRRNEGVEPEADDEQAVEGADRHADDKEDDDREIGIEHQARSVHRGIGHQPRREHRRDADDRLERQVELSDDQDDRLGEHEDRQFRGLLEDVDEVDLRQKRRMEKGADDQREDDQLQERQFVAHAQTRAPARRGRRGDRRQCGFLRVHGY